MSSKTRSSVTAEIARVGASRKPVCDLLLVNSTNLHDTLYRFRVISQLPNLFIGTPRICNFILLLIVCMCSYNKMLPSVKFSFSLFSVKNAKIVQL